MRIDVADMPFIKSYFYNSSFMSIVENKVRFNKSDVLISDLIWLYNQTENKDFFVDLSHCDSKYTYDFIPKNIISNDGVYEIFLGSYLGVESDSCYMYNYADDLVVFSFKLGALKEVYQWSQAGILIQSESNKKKEFKVVFMPNNKIRIESNDCLIDFENTSRYKFIKVLKNGISIDISFSTDGINWTDNKRYEEPDLDGRVKVGFFVWIGEDYFKSWFYTNFIQIHCGVGLKPIGDVKLNYYIPMIDNNYNVLNPWLEQYKLPANSKITNGEIISVVKSYLEQGFCLSVFLNEKYIPGMRTYNVKDFIHENLVCGIDEEKNELLLQGFLKKTGYSTYTLSYDQFVKSYMFANVNKEISIMKFKIPDEPYVFSINTIIDFLSEYIKGINSSYRESLVKNINHRVYGVEVYNEILKDVTVLKDKRISFLIYEHKLLMKYRMEYILSMTNNFSEDNINYYKCETKKICSLAEQILILSMKYKLTNDEKLISVLSNKINKLKCDEIIFISHLIDVLKSNL